VQYDAVVVNDETEIDTTVPVPVPGSATPCLLDVKFKDRDVIVARGDPMLRLTNAHKDHFHNVISFTTDFGATLTLLRGWASVDVRRGAAFFRFIDTHLEAVSDVYRDAQAGELLLGPALTLQPLLVVGDFNFDSGPLPTTAFATSDSTTSGTSCSRAPRDSPAARTTRWPTRYRSSTTDRPRLDARPRHAGKRGHRRRRADPDGDEPAAVGVGPRRRGGHDRGAHGPLRCRTLTIWRMRSPSCAADGQRTADRSEAGSTVDIGVEASPAFPAAR